MEIKLLGNIIPSRVPDFSNKNVRGPKDVKAELRLEVNMDEEKGRKPRMRDGRPTPDIHGVRMKQATRVRMDILRAYVDGTLLDWDNEILEAINFLDHLLREYPSKNLINLRSSYFWQPKPNVLGNVENLGGGVEAWKGVYQSLRMAEGKKLVINADVSNACFWRTYQISQIFYEMVGSKDPIVFQVKMSKGPDASGDPWGWKVLKRFVKCHVHTWRPTTGVCKYTLKLL